MARIILLSNSYKPQYGGLVSYLENFSRNVKSFFPEHEVEIVVFNNDKDLKGRDIINDVVVHRVLIPKVNAANILFYHRLLLQTGQKYIKENFSGKDYFVVRHIHFARVLSILHRDRTLFIVPVLIKKMLNFNYEKNNLLKNMFNFISIKQLSKIERNTMESLPNIGVLSKSKEEEVLLTYNRSSTIIKPAVDTMKFKPASKIEKEDILHNINRSEDKGKKILLTVSRLTKEKNTEMLIDAMPKISNQFVLYVVGDGELSEFLRKKVEEKNLNDRVVFFGKRDDIEKFYKVADLFALLSTYEGLGHVYLEAMATGVPIIALKNNPPKVINASKELIDNHINGFVIQTEDDLVNSINTLNEEKLNLMKKRSLEIALENYNWKKHILNCISLIDNKGKIKNE